jgi:predicted O-methyltransferase YrrM
MRSDENGLREYGPEAPVPISQYKKEFEPLLKLYKKIKPKRVLEIGTHYGGTLFHWAENCEPDTIIVTVDDYHINSDYYKEWQSNAIITPILGKSQDEHVLWAAKMLAPYDWIFIDGGHTYDEVKADWLNYRELASNTSIIAFHDILPHRNSEVCLLWKEICAQDYATMEFVEDYEQAGCGIGVVFYDGA